MATKTISLAIDAYEKLLKAKRTRRESFSEVVRRAIIPDDTIKARDLRAYTARRTRFLSEATLDQIDEEDRKDPHPTDPWRQ